MDTETEKFQSGDYTHHNFKMGWTRYMRLDTDLNITSDSWQHWIDKYDVCRYISDISNDKTVTWIIAHNIFFDLQVIGFFRLFTYWGWELDFIYDKGLSFILIIHLGSKALKCISSSNYFDYSLSQIGEEIGLPKLDVDFEKANFSELKIYCKRDVEILSKACLSYMQFNKEHDTGNFSLTKASQCFTCYRHRFMDEKIYIHENRVIQQLERAAYFGGRTECFRFGKIPSNDFVCLDVNSMYPFIMKKYPMPTRLIDYYESPSLERYLKHKDSTCQVAKCRVITKKAIYGFRHNGKLIFPIGEFDCYLSTGGLSTAWKQGHLINIYELAIYQKKHIFNDYVDYWYKLKNHYRVKKEKSYEQITKLYLNALYGKFGMKRSIEDMIDAPDDVLPYRLQNMDIETGLRWTEYCLFNKAVRLYGEMETPISFPAIPAHITEYARLYLYELINRLPLGEVFYCDTDSIFIARDNLRHFDDLLNDNKLGYLSIDKEFSTLVINGCKDYIIDGKRIVKGVPRRAELIGNNTYKYDEFLGLNKHLSLELGGTFLTQERIKIVTPKYDKGEILPDGSIKPFLLS